MISRRGFITGATVLALMPKKGFAMDGFWVPDEALPHERTFMQWPVSREVHSDRYFLDDLQQSIADVANAIAEFEPVVMLMDKRHVKKARRKLSDAVEIWDIPTEDLWARDSGPLFVVNSAGEMAVRSLNFNGWGGKQTHKNDGQIAKRVASELGLPFLDNALVGEAGGVETNGEGTLLAHESSWVNTNRNRGSKAEISKMLLKAYGAEHIIWAPGVAGADITDYHIDSLARFVAPDTVLIQMPEEIIQGDPWTASAYETYDILAKAKTAEGVPIKLVELSEPINLRVDSEDFVPSYVNYYLCNGAVIMAAFGDKRTDAEAIETMKMLYPNREIVTLNVDPIGEVGGGIHCATQQQPKV